jgi:hypothetical protein
VVSAFEKAPRYRWGRPEITGRFRVQKNRRRSARRGAAAWQYQLGGVLPAKNASSDVEQMTLISHSRWLFFAIDAIILIAHMATLVT